MKNFIKILLIFSVLPIMVINCQNEVAALEKISETPKATIVFAGDPSVDGCGWLLSIENKLYHPVNLASDYKVDSLKVSIKYELQSGTWTCGWRSPGYENIEIKEIKKL